MTQIETERKRDRGRGRAARKTLCRRDKNWPALHILVAERRRQARRRGVPRATLHTHTKKAAVDMHTTRPYTGSESVAGQDPASVLPCAATRASATDRTRRTRRHAACTQHRAVEQYKWDLSWKFRYGVFSVKRRLCTCVIAARCKVPI
jgi:hypothetical protein